MFSMGMFSLLPVCVGSEAELPMDRRSLLMSFSHGVLDTEIERKMSDAVLQERVFARFKSLTSSAGSRSVAV